MNIAELKRIDVEYDDKKQSHTIYINQKDAQILVLQPTIQAKISDIDNALLSVNNAIKYATTTGLAILGLAPNVELKVINLGNREDLNNKTE